MHVPEVHRPRRHRLVSKQPPRYDGKARMYADDRYRRAMQASHPDTDPWEEAAREWAENSEPFFSKRRIRGLERFWRPLWIGTQGGES